MFTKTCPECEGLMVPGSGSAHSMYRCEDCGKVIGYTTIPREEYDQDSEEQDREAIQADHRIDQRKHER